MTTLHRQSQHPSLPSPEAYSRALDEGMKPRTDDLLKPEDYERIHQHLMDCAFKKPDSMPTDWPSRLIIAARLVLSFFVAFCAYKLFN